MPTPVQQAADRLYATTVAQLEGRGLITSHRAGRIEIHGVGCDLIDGLTQDLDVTSAFHPGADPVIACDGCPEGIEVAALVEASFMAAMTLRASPAGRYSAYQARWNARGRQAPESESCCTISPRLGHPLPPTAAAEVDAAHRAFVHAVMARARGRGRPTHEVLISVDELNGPNGEQLLAYHAVPGNDRSSRLVAFAVSGRLAHALAGQGRGAAFKAGTLTPGVLTVMAQLDLPRSTRREWAALADAATTVRATLAG